MTTPHSIQNDLLEFGEGSNIHFLGKQTQMFEFPGTWEGDHIEPDQTQRQSTNTGSQSKALLVSATIPSAPVVLLYAQGHLHQITKHIHMHWE